MKPKLTYDGEFYVWKGGYDTRELPKKAWFSWSPERRCWLTHSRSHAAKLHEYADYEARVEMGSKDARIDDDMRRWAIRECLAQLSGAGKRGFWSPDRALGVLLAAKSELDPEQAALGAAILERHRSRLAGEWLLDAAIGVEGKKPAPTAVDVTWEMICEGVIL